VIRRARPDEGPAIASLFRRSFGTLTFLPTLHTPEEDREFFDRALAQSEVWVWDEDGRVRGFAALGDGMLHHLYVDPDDQRRGVGAALLEHAKQQQLHQGIRLWTFQRNANARRFYERRGFHTVELTDGSANEEREPDVLYEWLPE
jgi:putative acetyltransferase